MSSNYKFVQKIDELPNPLKWIYDRVTVTGDKIGEDGKVLTQIVDLWKRDPVDVIRELLSRPAFRELLVFAPERRFLDRERQSRVIDEMWTAEWWWDIQVSVGDTRENLHQELTGSNQTQLPEDATVCPVILASDKTQLSQHRGDQAAWPVYLTIGNLPKETRRQISQHATVLIGYLPVEKLECFTDRSRSAAGWNLFHHCLRKILAPLEAAGRDGVDILCADGFIRRVFPLVAAYIGDHPEQCLVAEAQENTCPKGKVPKGTLGEDQPCALRDPADTISLLERHRDGLVADSFLEGRGVRPGTYDPFWAHLPHCNIFTCIILHELV